MKNFLLFILLTLQIFAGIVPPVQAAAAIPPKPATNIYVQDYAKVLTPQTARYIQSQSQAIAAKTKAQIAVVTIPSLEGASLEDYSLQLFRQWGIGDKQKNNGVLLLVAVNDRKSRIEVGYGLEGILPDGLTGRIQDETMIPYFKRNNFDRGILNGYSNISKYVLKEYGLTANNLGVKTPANYRKVSQPNPEMPWWQTALIALGIIAFLIIDQMFLGGIFLRVIFFLILHGGRGGRGGGFGGGSSGGGGSSRSW